MFLEFRERFVFLNSKENNEKREVGMVFFKGLFLIFNFFFLGVIGIMKNYCFYLVWEVFYGILVLLGCFKVFCVIYSGLLVFFGLGFLSGRGFKKRLCF